MLNESVPIPPSPERPPLAPYDPPDPAPQAKAWRRAIKVIMRQEAEHRSRMIAMRNGSRRHYDRSSRADRHHHHAI